MTLAHSVQVKPVYTYVHSQHHQIGSAITPLGTAFGDALDIGLCFVAFHLVLGAYLYYQPAWNIAAVVLLIVFEVGVLLNTPWTAYLSAACRLHLCTQHNRQRHVVHPTPYSYAAFDGFQPLLLYKKHLLLSWRVPNGSGLQSLAESSGDCTMHRQNVCSPKLATDALTSSTQAYVMHPFQDPFAITMNGMPACAGGNQHSWALRV